MKFKLLLACTLLAGAVTSSCVDDIPGIDAKEQYTRDFVKTFGVFDPKHDWNYATQASVTVNTTQPTEVQIYADYGQRQYRFATYTNVIGSKELSVDVPKGVTDLIIKANGKSYTTKVGGAVSIDSRVVVEPGENDKLTWRYREKRALSNEIVTKYMEAFPHDGRNLDTGVTSFYFISDGEEHTFYPILSQTDKVHALGIYYIDPDSDDPNGITMQDLYYTNTGEYDINNPTWEQSMCRGITYQLNTGIRYGFYLKCGYANRDGVSANFFTEAGQEPSGGSYSNTASWNGVTVIPNDPEDQNHRFTLFSQATRNTSWVDYDSQKRETEYQYDIRTGDGWAVCSWWDDSKFTELDKHSYASWDTFTITENGEEKTYAAFAFEDWPPVEWGRDNCDLNDLVFVFDPDDEHLPQGYNEDAGYTWIIACEDLGANDFDFNDVVFGISDIVTDAQTGEVSLKITPLAAGGTLPVYLMHDSKLINPAGTNDGEFHSWFTGNHTSSTVINAGSYSAKGKPYTHKFIPANGQPWSIACCQEVSGGNMGGFSLKVVHKDGEQTIIESPTRDGFENSVGSPAQMICVPSTWYWPTEQTHILSVYADFSKWCENRDNTDWHEHRNGVNKNKVVRHSFAQMGDAPSQGGTGEDINPTDPVFSLSTTEVTIGQTARVRVNTKRDLAEIKLSEITYSNPGIVTVDEDGVITPLAKGETTISFKSSATDQFNASESRGVLTITVIEGTPTFALWDRTIQPGESTRIVIKGEKGLDGVKLVVPVTCTPDGIVTVDKDGNIKANEDVKETTDVEITFNSTEVTDRYFASEGNTLKLRVFVPIKGIDEPLTPYSHTVEDLVAWPSKRCELFKYNLTPTLQTLFETSNYMYLYFSHDSEKQIETYISYNEGASWDQVYHSSLNVFGTWINDGRFNTLQQIWIAYDKAVYDDNVSKDYDGGIMFEFRNGQ